jgi:hypothetical protein
MSKSSSRLSWKAVAVLAGAVALQLTIVPAQAQESGASSEGVEWNPPPPPAPVEHGYPKLEGQGADARYYIDSDHSVGGSLTPNSAGLNYRFPVKIGQ